MRWKDKDEGKQIYGVLWDGTESSIQVCDVRRVVGMCSSHDEHFWSLKGAKLHIAELADMIKTDMVELKKRIRSLKIKDLETYDGEGEEE